MVTIFHRNETQEVILVLDTDTFEYETYDLDLNPVTPSILPFKYEVKGDLTKIYIEDRWFDGTDTSYNDCIIEVRESPDFATIDVLAKGADEHYIYVEDVELPKPATKMLEAHLKFIVQPQLEKLFEVSKTFTPEEEYTDVNSTPYLSRIICTIDGYGGAWRDLRIKIFQNGIETLNYKLDEIKNIWQFRLDHKLLPKLQTTLYMKNENTSSNASVTRFRIWAVYKNYVLQFKSFRNY